MKKLILALLVLFTVQAFSQQVVEQRLGKVTLQPDVRAPSTLFAGTVMSVRSLTSSYDDTTRFFNTRGFAAVYVGVEFTANDSGRVIVSYQPSPNGTSFGPFVTLDSLSTTGTVGVYKYFALPANALGAYGVRVRVYANTDLLRYSDSPTTKVTTKVIRVAY